MSDVKHLAREDLIGSVEYWETGANIRTRVEVSEETSADGKTWLFVTERRAMRCNIDDAAKLAAEIRLEPGQSKMIRQEVANLKTFRKEWQFYIPTFCVKRMAELLDTVAERAKGRSERQHAKEKETA
jgi:hypothetical protein